MTKAPTRAFCRSGIDMMRSGRASRRRTRSQQLGREPELHLLLDTGQYRNFDGLDSTERSKDVIDQCFRRGGACRDAHHGCVADPPWVELAAIGQQIAWH